MRRLIVGISGATGAPLGVALLKALREMPDVETHLIISKWVRATSAVTRPRRSALADVI